MSDTRAYSNWHFVVTQVTDRGQVYNVRLGFSEGIGDWFLACLESLHIQRKGSLPLAFEKWQIVFGRLLTILKNIPIL